MGIHDAELVAKDDLENGDDEEEVDDDDKWSHVVVGVSVCHIYQWLIVILINNDKISYCKDVHSVSFCVRNA